jgi:hypothetical protein
MNSAALLIILGQQAAEPLPFPLDVMRGAAFQAVYAPRQIVPVGSQHFLSTMDFVAPDLSALMIRVYWTKNIGQSTYTSEPLDTARGEKTRLSRFNTIMSGRGTFSGAHPKYAGYKRDKDGILFYLDSTWASAVCFWTPPLIDNGTRFWESAPFDAEVKSAFVEKIARHTLIRAAGLRLDPIESDDSSPSAKCRLTQVKFGDLTTWAELNGWKIGDENDYGIITLKKGDVEAVLPLGADQIKVKGAWKEMGDSAAFFNGKLYLPESGLKHLKGA